MAKKEIIKEAWESEFGKIEVGDSIAVVTEGFSHRMNIRAGTYLGYITRKTYNGEYKFVKALVEMEKWGWFVGESDKRCHWGDPGVKGRYYRAKCETTLQLNRIIPLPPGFEPFLNQINKNI